MSYLGIRDNLLGLSPTGSSAHLDGNSDQAVTDATADDAHEENVDKLPLHNLQLREYVSSVAYGNKVYPPSAVISAALTATMKELTRG